MPTSVKITRLVFGRDDLVLWFGLWPSGTLLSTRMVFKLYVVIKKPRDFSCNEFENISCWRSTFYVVIMYIVIAILVNIDLSSLSYTLVALTKDTEGFL